MKKTIGTIISIALLSLTIGASQSFAQTVPSYSNLCKDSTLLLKQGMKSPEVADLQLFLRNTFSKNLSATGYYGAYTKRVVANFQSYHKLPKTDGIVSVETMAKIKSLACSQTVTTSPVSAVKITTATKTLSTSTIVVSTSTITTVSTIPTGNKAQYTWLEPYSISPNVTARAGTPTKTDLDLHIKGLKDRNVNTLIIAYSEYLNCFIYKPTTPESYYSLFRTKFIDSNGAPVYYDDGKVVDSSKDYCPILSDGNFVDETLASAKKYDMKVIIGLTKAGNEFLLQDIENTLRGNMSQVGFQGVNINDRLSSVVTINKQMVTDMWNKYASAYSGTIAGWYLPLETGCVDVGMNYYGPVADHIKSVAPNTKVMISPTIDAGVCFNAVTYTDLIKQYKNIDIYAYQDGLGAAYKNGQYTYDDTVRYEAITNLPSPTGKLTNLQKSHTGTNAEFWINLEAWEMDGNCPFGVGGGNVDPNKKYGCNYPGKPARIKAQLDAFSKLTNKIMINDAFGLFDFDIPNMHFKDSGMLQKAKDLTKFYTDNI